MKKSAIVVIVIVTILVVVGSLCMFMKKEDDKKEVDKPSEPVETEKLETGIKFLETKEKDGKLIQEYELIMNNKKKNIEVVFEKNKEGNSIIGTLNGVKVYNFVGDIDETVNLADIDLSSSDFKFIKGVDNKEYLLVVRKFKHFVGKSYELVVMNENLTQIKNENLSYSGCDAEDAFTILTTFFDFDFEDKKSSRFKDEFGVCKDDDCLVNLKIDDNKITYYQIVEYGMEPLKVQKREYTIKNDKLEYIIINENLNGVNIAGQAC